MAAKPMLYIGIDGGASSSKLVLIDENEKVLSKFVSGSCNKNNIGFDNAAKNVSDGIHGLLTLAKRSKSDVAGICMTTAGCTMIADKVEWQTAIAKILDNKHKKSVRIEVHNDSVGDIASVCPKEMSGIVCIVGTGFIVCGYRGDPNVEYRAGGWGPMFGDDASGYFIGEKVLKAAALYYDICGDAEKRYVDDEEKSDVGTAVAGKSKFDMQLVSEYGGSMILYSKLMNKSGVKEFGSLVDWTYNAKDKYKQVAECALLAIESYNECLVAKQIIDNAVSALLIRLLLILNKMYPKQSFDYDKYEDINIVCGGSILLKSKLFLDLFRKQLTWKLGGDGRQTYIKFVKPEREPQLGSALYIKHKCETS